MNREEPKWLLQTIPRRRDRGAFRVGAVRARENLLSDYGRRSPGTRLLLRKSIRDHDGHHSTECMTTQF
jgi:hypothetical protein